MSRPRRRLAPSSSSRLAAFLARATLFSLPLVHAAVTPTAPGPGDVFEEGGQCSFSYSADRTGKWDSFDVDLMSGSNFVMNTITRVASGLDGSTGDTVTFDCPQVTPNSAIYFYQFTQDGTGDTWTTRFTIAAADGSTTDPANAEQTDGSAVPWGIGALAGGANSSTTASSSVRSSMTSGTLSSGSSTGSASVTSTTSSASSSSTTDTTTTSETTTSSSSTETSETTTQSDSTLSSSSASASASRAAASNNNEMFYSSWPLAGRIGLFAGIGVAGLIILILILWLILRTCRRRRRARDEPFGPTMLTPQNKYEDDAWEDPYYNGDKQVQRDSVGQGPNNAGRGAGAVAPGVGASPYGWQEKYDERYSPLKSGEEVYPLVQRPAAVSTASFDAYGQREGGGGATGYVPSSLQPGGRVRDSRESYYGSQEQAGGGWNNARYGQQQQQYGEARSDWIDYNQPHAR